MSQAPFIQRLYIQTQLEALWAALTEPAQTRAYFDFMEGVMAIESVWRPGSRVSYRTDDGQTQLEGKVLAYHPPNHLQLQLSLCYDPDLQHEPPTVFTWDIAPLDDVCKLTFTYAPSEAAPRTYREVTTCMPMDPAQPARTA